ncbi:elongation factor 1-gamma, putative [Plasmodium relictum]|uniref:Elongation factor 1-gamma, putative n=1 Tax=Plasmodium relictum TaxID=85471 RepID=A0A1J1HA61_PLARL|nr:elongation factor 1-gamma, putative [Plasmodium relictum]CRH01704.1 elongation factor 1-gamma, putative [Plasmodium relictum]
MDLKLLAPKNDIRSLKVQVVASFCNLKLNIPEFKLGKDDKSEEFLKHSPLGRLPVLLTSNGALFESNAICKYLCNLRREHNLLGQGIFEEAEVNMWMDFNTYELEIPICCYVTNKSCEKSLNHIKDSFNCLNNHLLLNQFMVGNFITLADICICVIINFALKSEKLDESILKKYKNLHRLFDTISNQKQFKYVFSDSNNKKAQEKNKKVEKKPNDKKKKNSDDEDQLLEDEFTEKKQKKTNPLDLLPPSSFSLDEWKYKFSNEKDLLNNAMPHFWKIFDKNGWSLFYMKYDKLEDECQISFVACNMAGGFLQRLENNFSKYSFAVVSVLGENKSYDIEGVWLFRGTEIPFEMKDHPSFEYHIFKQLDANNDSDRKIVEDYWCSKETISNRPVVDRKVWK